MILNWRLYVLRLLLLNWRLLRQFALVSKILDESKEIKWPTRKWCSTNADFCGCLGSTAFCVPSVEKQIAFRFTNVALVTILAVNRITERHESDLLGKGLSVKEVSFR